jgi:MFS transporter, DHA1 family, tetracycline resistance protein
LKQGANQSVASLAGIAGPIFFGWVYGMSILTMPGLSFFVAAAILLSAAAFSRLGSHRASPLPASAQAEATTQ